jgi:hypothetical protein
MAQFDTSETQNLEKGSNLDRRRDGRKETRRRNKTMEGGNMRNKENVLRIPTAVWSQNFMAWNRSKHLSERTSSKITFIKLNFRFSGRYKRSETNKHLN